MKIEQSTKHSEREWLRKEENTTKIDRTYVWAARITLVIFLVIILSGILWNDAVIKSRREADFLLCGWEIHFVYNPFVDWYVICQSV